MKGYTLATFQHSEFTEMVDGLADLVEELMADGWRLYGDPKFSRQAFEMDLLVFIGVQAMTHPKSSKELE